VLPCHTPESRPRLIDTLDDTLSRFAGLQVEAAPGEVLVRAGAMALAQDWLLRLPPGPARDQAIDLLRQATAQAVQALRQ